MNAPPPSTASVQPFVLHAPNVHSGGGRALLLPLLSALKAPATVLLDTRLQPLPPIPAGITLHCFPPTLAGRFRAEMTLRRLCRAGSKVLCFGNLPPLLAQANGDTSVFLQNRYLLPNTGMDGLPLKTKARLLIEKLWLRHRRAEARILVQSQTMAIATRAAFGGVVEICPFSSQLKAPDKAAVQRYDYLYVASAEAHKNHSTLFSAWAQLARSGVTPSLAVTLSETETKGLESAIRAARALGARIEVLPPRPVDQMPALYAATSAIIYPSLFESFGLPLIEAKAAGLPILASERDYVRDLIDPVESFDPTSYRSIARAVCRHLGHTAEREPILDAEAFLARVRGTT